MIEENPRIFISAETWELRRSLQEIKAAFHEAMAKIAADLLAKKLAFIVLGGYAWSRGESPSTRYKLAGRPFGKNRAGKKRWVREMRKWKDTEIANIIKDAKADAPSN